MIVVDASAALAALLNAGAARRALGGEQLHVPHLIDAEVASGLRRQVASARIGPDAGWTALDVWRHLGMVRYPIFGILDRVSQLRDNLSASEGITEVLHQDREVFHLKVENPDRSSVERKVDALLADSEP